MKKPKESKQEKFMARVGFALRNETNPENAMNMVYEIRGFIVSNFTTIDSVRMTTLYESAKILLNVANKKRKKS
jgi:hypothetical protein